MDGPHVHLHRDRRSAKGPVWCPRGAGAPTRGHARVSPASSEGALSRVWPRVRPHGEQVADTGGGAERRGAGGRRRLRRHPERRDRLLHLRDVRPMPPPPSYVPSGLQRVDARRHRQRTSPPAPCSMPNDLCVAPDGTVFFTDPPWLPAARPAERARARARPDGALRVVADGFWYANGIGLDHRRRRPSSSWRTASTVRDEAFVRLRPDGTREPFADGPTRRRVRARRRRADLHGGGRARDHRVRARRHGGRAADVARATTGARDELLLRWSTTCARCSRSTPARPDACTGGPRCRRRASRCTRGRARDDAAPRPGARNRSGQPLRRNSYAAQSTIMGAQDAIAGERAHAVRCRCTRRLRKVSQSGGSGHRTLRFRPWRR